MAYTDIVYTDVLIIGAGPAGLSAAIKIADNTVGKGYRIMVLEKGKNVGSHILSGAIIKPDVFNDLLPDVNFNDIPFYSKVGKNKTVLINKKRAFKLPFNAPYMGNKGNYLGSLGNICQYLAKIAEEKGVEIYTGFSVNELIYEDNKVVGAKTIDTGVDRCGNPMKNHQIGTAVKAKLIILAEGTLGTLTKEVINKYNLDKGCNPQMYSLGCKEIWHVPKSKLKPGQIYNTMGYPLTKKQFGGGFIYGLTEDKVAIGLVVGLDYADPTFDTHDAFQIWKTQPFVKKFINNGTLLEYGAKTLPEGGLYSIPKLYTDNVMIVGDSAGFILMPDLKGVHPAMVTGMLSAEVASEALEKNDFSEEFLSKYEKLFQHNKLYKQFGRSRNFRQAFSKGIYKGGFHFAMQLMSRGNGLNGHFKSKPDAKTTKKLRKFKKKNFQTKYQDKLNFDNQFTFDKVTDIFYSGVHYDENQIPHLQVNDIKDFNKVNIKKYGAPCQYFCPADVYEIHTNKDGQQELLIHFENCVQCKTCEIKSPSKGITWNLPYGGNGPDYQNM